MSQNLRSSSERLYLSKPTVYIEVDTDKLQQHEIEGIRFLYKQFKKKNPGVILNDPLGYSHTLQVVLFINAVLSLQSRAVLILCHHSNLSNWAGCFKKWTKIYDDIAIDVSNQFLHRSVFISSIDNMELFCRRDWGIIVVDHDDFLQYKQMPPKFNADYKIYITPHDMKENLDKFAAIFKWFHPKGQLNVDEFRPNTNNLRDVVTKSIIFQAFVDDIVLRRSNILSRPDTCKNPCPENRVSRKNKDATGTKIKRSKRKADDSTEDPQLDIKIRCEIDLAGSKYHIASHNSSNDNNEILDDHCDVNSAMDVESFIRSQEPIESDVFRDFVPDFDDNISRCSSRIEDIEEDDFQNNNDVDEKNVKDDKFIADSSVLTFNGNGEEIKSPENSLHLHYSEDVSQVLDTSEKDDDYLLFRSPARQISNEIENVSPEKFEDTIKNNKITLNSESNSPIHDITNDSIKHVPITGNGLHENIVSEVESEKEINKEAGGNLKVTTGVKDLNAKLRELEEKTLQKFKGSLLDRIF